MSTDRLSGVAVESGTAAPAAPDPSRSADADTPGARDGPPK